MFLSPEGGGEGRKRINKYFARRCFSELAQREFDSKRERDRAEELILMEKAGLISDLQFQILFTLSEHPKVSVKIDFSYLENGERKYEDSKGMETREFRVKRIWLKQLHNIDVELV